MQRVRLTISCIATAVCSLAAGFAPPPVSAMVVPCARTLISERRLPTGPAQYESGSLKLANGATLRLQGSKADMYRARAMSVGDPVAACYGPLKQYADAGPARTITVLDLSNGEYFATLIGTWKRQ